MNNKVLLKQDSRDLHLADYFGSIDAIPLEIEFDKGIANPIEESGGIDCTAISACDTCANQTGTLYDKDDLWTLTPHTEKGATPQDSLGTVIKQGLKPVNGGSKARDTRWTSYFRSDGTSGDYFATTQASMVMAQSPTIITSNWYAQWSATPHEGVLPMGGGFSSGHAYEATGWRQTPTGPQLHIKAWNGSFYWMPKDVYNAEMNKYGTGAYIPSTAVIESRRKKTLMEMLRDACVNLILLLKRQLVMVQPITPPIVPPETPVPVKYLWDNFDNARHSVHLICDEEKLSLTEKDIIFACIEQESKFDNTAINHNKNLKGQTTSTDWGICQINDFYQIGQGLSFSSVKDVVDNPDKAVRFMIRMYKAGKLNLWVSFSSGAYKKYL